MWQIFFLFLGDNNVYTDEQINEMFKDKYNTIDPLCKDYFDTYIHFYKRSFTRPCKSNKFHMHHFFPSFIYKQMIGEKNRYHTIEMLDEAYSPNDNVCKLRILYHVLAHYFLAKAMKGTAYEFDANNAFYTLIGDYSRNIDSYTYEEVKEIGRLIEENVEPNEIDHYMTQSETKEHFKQKQKDWEEKHEEEILRNKEFMKQKRKESQEKWKEEHKDEIEERKRQQREYAKKMRKEIKKKFEEK